MKLTNFAISSNYADCKSPRYPASLICLICGIGASSLIEFSNLVCIQQSAFDCKPKKLCFCGEFIKKSCGTIKFLPIFWPIVQIVQQPENWLKGLEKQRPIEKS